MSVIDEIVQVLLEHGPMDTDGLMTYIKAKHDTIHSKALILMANNLLSRNEKGEWVLSKEVTKDTPLPKDYPGKEGEGSGASGGAAGGAGGLPLEPRPFFEATLKGVGIGKDFIPTITQFFFNGDIDSLPWLREVLTRHSAGFVSPQQARFVLASWAKTRGLPFNPDEYPIEGTEAGRGGRGPEKQPAKSIAKTLEEETGILYKIAKDKDGEWVPVAGGNMTYEVALAAAQKSNYIKAIGREQSGEGEEDVPAPGEGKPGAKGGRAPRSFTEIFMDKAIDYMFDPKRGHGDEDSPLLKAMQDQLKQANQTIQQMREDREREWHERIEANIATIASRDPWSDPVEIARARQVLGVQTSAITDQSPAVQILKDSADKIDKNVGRLVGIVERVALRADEFRPEETRSPAERETKAGQILDEAGRRERSKILRQRAFGV